MLLCLVFLLVIQFYCLVFLSVTGVGFVDLLVALDQDLSDGLVGFPINIVHILSRRRVRNSLRIHLLLVKLFELVAVSLFNGSRKSFDVVNFLLNWHVALFDMLFILSWLSVLFYRMMILSDRFFCRVVVISWCITAENTFSFTALFGSVGFSSRIFFSSGKFGRFDLLGNKSGD